MTLDDLIKALSQLRDARPSLSHADVQVFLQEGATPQRISVDERGDPIVEIY